MGSGTSHVLRYRADLGSVDPVRSQGGDLGGQGGRTCASSTSFNESHAHRLGLGAPLPHQQLEPPLRGRIKANSDLAVIHES